MTSLFKRLFGSRSTAGSVPADKVSAQADAPTSRFGDSRATVEDSSDIGMRSQLIHVLLRDALRRHGLPAHWIECQILQVASRRRGTGMFVRLIVRHWDVRLMQHLMAFEKAFQTDIERFEPGASQWLHGISWQIQPLNGCPYTQMPDKAFWLANPPSAPVIASSAPPPVVASRSEAEKLPLQEDRGPALSDVQRLFAIRDEEIAKTTSPGSASDYAPTEPSTLHRQ